MPAVLRRVILGVLLTSSFLLAGGSATARAQTATTTPTAAASATPASTAAPTTGDSQSSRTVNRIVLALLALAGLLAVLTVWLWRASKPKPNHLDGLDAMGSHHWRRATPEGRAAILAPVHERRGDIRDEQLIAAPEPGEPAGEVAAEPAEAVEAVEAVEAPEPDEPGAELPPEETSATELPPEPPAEAFDPQSPAPSR